MTSRNPETVRDQADTVRVLLHHLHIPLGPKQYVRGILPAPKGRNAIRVAAGRRKDRVPDFRLYEIPLTHEHEPVTPHHTLALLRAAHRGTRIYSSSRVDEVMGMTLIRLNPSEDATTAPTTQDRQLSLLTTLTCPPPDENDNPTLPLVGFLPTAPDTLRLYLAPDHAPGVIAADVRLSGALTAVEAALPALLAEEERWRKAKKDPHCRRRVDLTDW